MKKLRVCANEWGGDKSLALERPYKEFCVQRKFLIVVQIRPKLNNFLSTRDRLKCGGKGGGVGLTPDPY